MHGMKKQPKGFTMFFAALVGSLALAIGISMYDITVRQIILSSVISQSQYAIYAADAGIECALYWDSKCTLSTCDNGTAFAMSSSLPSVGFPPTSGVICNGFDIAAVGTPPSTYIGQAQASPAWTSWQLELTPTSAITTFTFTMPAVNPHRCVQVTVAKYIDGSGSPKTVITSRGYNVCVVSSTQTPLERVLEVIY